jgi:hypothetical protein
MDESIVDVKLKAVRITLDIPTSLYQMLKERAAVRGRSSRELILAEVQAVLLDSKPPQKKKVRFRLIVSKGSKVNLSNKQIYKRVEFP